MDANTLVDGLILYLGLIVLLTFHEFGHAWMAMKCGDNTAKLLGRVSLNPLVHIDPVGTVLLPLLMIFVPGAGRFVIGGAKPVPVNLHNLRNPRLDDILVTLAGPWMNVLLAVLLMGLARVGLLLQLQPMTDLCSGMARLSLRLCVFNLLPIPPLDGSQIVRNLIGMSYEVYRQLSRFGYFIIILLLQIQALQQFIGAVTDKSWMIIGGWFGMSVG